MAHKLGGDPYPEGRSLALLFIDERESLKPKAKSLCSAENSAQLAVSLARCGYELSLIHI